jgi:hypothetical protein
VFLLLDLDGVGVFPRLSGALGCPFISKREY